MAKRFGFGGQTKPPPRYTSAAQGKLTGRRMKDAMPLEAWIENKSYLAETSDEMSTLIDKVIEDIGNEKYEVVDGRSYYTANQVATLSLCSGIS
jgi:hypothetical protein